MVPRWKAAKAALVLMMRSWVGVVLLTSEEMGLPTLVRMLQDPKVIRFISYVLPVSLNCIRCPFRRRT
jgi:hypothetical protein